MYYFSIIYVILVLYRLYKDYVVNIIHYYSFLYPIIGVDLLYFLNKIIINLGQIDDIGDDLIDGY